MQRAKEEQLPLPLHTLCSKCGQPILNEPPSDPLGDAILRVLRAAKGRLVKMQLILGFIGMKAGRTSVHERLKVYESDGWVARDPQHPRMGYKITALGMQAEDQRDAA